MVTEEVFLKDPCICEGCKDYWRRHHQPRRPWVCVDCARLESEFETRGRKGRCRTDLDGKVIETEG